MPRTPVITRIAAILDAAPVAHDWRPQDYTHRDLACEVYDLDDDDDDEPTTAQLSAVRRAVAKLVAAGRAVRIGRDPQGHSAPGTHERRRPRSYRTADMTEAQWGRIADRDDSKATYVYSNPAGVRVRRPLTDAEQTTRERLAAEWRAKTDELKRSL